MHCLRLWDERVGFVSPSPADGPSLPSDVALWWPGWRRPPACPVVLCHDPLALCCVCCGLLPLAWRGR